MMFFALLSVKLALCVSVISLLSMHGKERKEKESKAFNRDFAFSCLCCTLVDWKERERENWWNLCAQRNLALDRGKRSYSGQWVKKKLTE